jgi:cytochrome c oxidase assembly protein subunit 15
VALTGALALATYAQILLGAVMRHIGAGLAIPDFPLSMSRLIPPLTSAAVIINFSHRVGAAVVTLLALAAIFACLRTPVRELRRLAVFIAAIVALQVALGASVVLLAGGNEKIFHSLVGDEAMRLAMITSLHVVTGAATLATTLLAALVSRAVAQPASRDVAAYSPSEVAA